MVLVELARFARRVVMVRRPRVAAPGGTEVADARRLADSERAAGRVPDGCAWLDERTVGDLDLPLVFRALDRTATPTGAQVLWRWLAAPAVQLDVLAGREHAFCRFAADPGLRERARAALVGQSSSDAVHLPRLLWESPRPPRGASWFAALAVALVVLIALVAWSPIFLIACVALFVVNLVIDDWAGLGLAHHARALEVLSWALAAAKRLSDRGIAADAEVARTLARLAPLRAQLHLLTARDPLGLVDAVRAGLLIRPLLITRYLRVVERERDALRQLVVWLGELDAAVAVATLRTERPAARVPELTAQPHRLDARDIVHPAITGAIGNDLVADGGLLVTGSNMSGKSTFLRTVAINAICAQSIHTVFGQWQASLLRVFAVMRVADATADGMSTYAVEVAAIGALVDAVANRDPDLPALLVIDEPFSGTNPALRVPIVVSVLDYLGARDVVIAATHDLDVAAQVGPRFARGYFCEPDDATGRFDRKLRPGVAPTSNALALLVRAG